MKRAFLRLFSSIVLADAVLVLYEALAPPRGEETEARILKRIVRQGSSVVEVGARLGGSTRLISSLAKGGHVLVIEPNPYLAKSLRRLGARLGNVTVLDVAVGSKDGHADLLLAGPFDIAASLVAHRYWRRLGVTVATLDHLALGWNVFPVDILVIDAEGSEGAILSGAERILRDVQHVLVEVHGRTHPGLITQVNHSLSEHGLRLIYSEVDTGDPSIVVQLFGRSNEIEIGKALKGKVRQDTERALKGRVMIRATSRE